MKMTSSNREMQMNSAIVEDEEDDLRSLSVTSERASTIFDSESDQQTPDKEAYMGIAQREQRSVQIIRVITFAAVIVCAIVVCWLVYYFATGADTRNFELEYAVFVQGISQLVTWETTYNAALNEELASALTVEALISEQAFPFVTQPHFEITGGFVDGMGGIMMVLFAPLVTESQRGAWKNYSVQHQNWLNESEWLKVNSPHHRDPLHGTIQDHEHDRKLFALNKDMDLPETISIIPTQIWSWNGDDKVVVNTTSADGMYAPLWQSSPHFADTVNVDLLSDKRISNLYNMMIQNNEKIILSPGYEIGNLFDWMFDPVEKPRKTDPHGFIMNPVQVDFGKGKETAGFVLALTSFRNLFTRLVPEGTRGIFAVVTGNEACGRNMTFLLKGEVSEFLGWEDLHETDPILEEHKYSTPMEIYEDAPDAVCQHILNIYPSAAFRSSYDTNKPIVYTSIVALAFLVTTFFFIIYERLVTRREKTKNAALRVLSTMFPSNVQEKVLKGADGRGNGLGSQQNMIASFYPATTVLFADIEGFTAWSSTREPAQVFHMLETVYGAFDEIARRRGIFKVETVGDCYVAVCGVPEAKNDHAVAMVRFARDCLTRMSSLSQQLEVTLGPDTAELGFRVGIHSGPVTGGVLRGQNSRFQLFGDTMNMAARMESTGVRNKIQMSSATAKLLTKAGKDHWIEKRGDYIDVKGKGSQETYFLKSSTMKESSSGKTGSTNGATVEITDSASGDSDERQAVGHLFTREVNKNLSSKTSRLIDWNTEVLSRRICAIVKHKESLIDIDVNDLQLDKAVIGLLRHYIQRIACMYRDNPFHNFSHASHVTLSMEKMLSRVQLNSGLSSGYTNSICSDPLAQFAVVLAALIHDVDHQGISNATLVKQRDPIAIKYHGKSPAENHSLCVGWEVLMQPEYSKLVKTICGDSSKEVNRLKELLSNAVLATDVFDKDLKDSRNLRWARVFESEVFAQETTQELDKMKATIVLEHLIQASDVAHTMQHWHVYMKWNERLFEEMTNAYNSGHLAKNPADFWYEGELGFLNHYIIPLAKKLRECEIFGVSCDEFLNYAEANLQEWEIKGQEIVSEFSKKYKTMNFVDS